MRGEEDALWAEFAAESEEHLDTIEAVLGGLAPGTEGVNSLFRAFHSLKGMSDALGAQGLKALSHVAEDVLGQVRAGRLPLDPALAELLLQTVDTLRRQRRQVLERRPEPPADPALVARLRRLAGVPAGLPALPAAAPAGRGGPDPLLATLASRCRAAVPLLAGLAGPAPPAAAAREAVALAEGAALIGLHRLAAGLAALVGTGGGLAALPALGRLRRLLARLGEQAGESAGAAELPAALGAGPEGWLEPLLGLLEAGAAPAALAEAARDAAAMACALGQEVLEQRLLVLEDLADRVTEPDAAAALARGSAALLREAAPEPEGEPEAPDPELALPAAFLAVMGPEARRRALAARSAGQGLFLARLALGQDAALEELAGDWLRQSGEVLASHNPAGTEPPVLELLLASEAPLPELAGQAAALDPARRVLREIAPLPEAVPAGAGERPGEQAEASGPVTLRVRQETVDDIIALQAELSAAVLSLAEVVREGGTRAALGRLAGLEATLPAAAAARLATELDRLRQGQETLEAAESRLGLALRRLDDAVMGLRVVPVGTLLSRLPRVARAVAQAGGKRVDVALEGQDVAIDRGLVEILSDPLLHLVRNAVDHGLEAPAARRAAGKPERGLLRIAAAREGSEILVRVSDDGAGIDAARVLRRAVAQGLVEPASAALLPLPEVHALLFRPGFSTAERVTETSGRGVGLDVVQEAVCRAGGTLTVASRAGEGTAFLLRLPLTASIQSVLLVEVAGHPYALPAARVQGVTEAASLPAGSETRPLAALLGLPPAARGAAGEEGVAVWVRAGGRPLALLVDRVRRRSDLLLRPLHPALASLPGVGGMGVLGDGEPVVLLEPEGF